MTTFAPQTAHGRWISAAELAHESGLREDLVRRFMPADTTGPAPMYSAGAVPLAKYLKRLTDMGTPAPAVDAAVRELHNNSGAMMQISLAAPVAPSRRSRTLAISGAAAAATLIIGGVIGGLIGSGARDTAAPTAPAPATVTAAAPPIDVSVPAAADPVCAQWAPMNDGYLAKLAPWLKTDPAVPAAQWSSEQQQATSGAIQVMNAEAKDLAGLADKASDPVLKSMLKVQSEYISAFASRLPNYSPTDQRLWQAANDFGNAVNSRCYAVAPR